MLFSVLVGCECCPEKPHRGATYPVRSRKLEQFFKRESHCEGDVRSGPTCFHELTGSPFHIPYTVLSPPDDRRTQRMNEMTNGIPPFLPRVLEGESVSKNRLANLPKIAIFRRSVQSISRSSLKVRGGSSTLPILFFWPCLGACLAPQKIVSVGSILQEMTGDLVPPIINRTMRPPHHVLARA